MIKAKLQKVLKPYLKGTLHPYEDIPLILVSGIGRSGTTALRHALSAHPRVDSTECENNIVYDVTETARHNCTYWSRKGTMRVVQPAYDRQFRLLLLNLLWPEPKSGVHRPDALLAASDMGADRADYFCQMFPGCRIVYIVRNGIEVVASRMTHENFKDVPFDEHCRIWTQAAEMVRWGSTREALVVIRHEKLTSSPEEEMQAVLTRVGLRDCVGCANALKSQTFHPTQMATEDHASAADLKKRHKRWDLWTKEQRDSFRVICGNAMQSLGYETPG